MDVSETFGPVDTTISGTVGAIESSHAVMQTVLLLETHRHSDGQSEALYFPPPLRTTQLYAEQMRAHAKSKYAHSHIHMGRHLGWMDGWVGGEGEREREKRRRRGGFSGSGLHQ